MPAATRTSVDALHCMRGYGACGTCHTSSAYTRGARCCYCSWHGSSQGSKRLLLWYRGKCSSQLIANKIKVSASDGRRLHWYTGACGLQCLAHKHKQQLTNTARSIEIVSLAADVAAVYAIRVAGARRYNSDRLGVRRDGVQAPRLIKNIGIGVNAVVLKVLTP